MNSRRDNFRRELETKDVLFSCEGAAESTIIRRLSESGNLLVPEDHLVRDRDGRPFTSDRKAKDLQEDFLDVDYPHGLMIVRIVDVNPGKLEFAKLYRDRVVIRDVITRPEIESLVLVREGEYRDWYQHDKSTIYPSQWCISRLGYKDIKTQDFADNYWNNADDLIDTIKQYTTLLGGRKNEQLNLIDLLV